MNRKQVEVKWDGQDIKSLRAAERKKLRLENAGYKLIRESAGLFRSSLIYQAP